MVLVLGNGQWNKVLSTQVAHADEMTVYTDVAQVIKRISHEDMSLSKGWIATVKTQDACKDLRVSGLQKDDNTMYLFSNEGFDIIETEVTVPGTGKPVFGMLLLQRSQTVILAIGSTDLNWLKKG